MEIQPGFGQDGDALIAYLAYKESLANIFRQRQREVERIFKDDRYEPTVILDLRITSVPDPITKFVGFLYRARSINIWRIAAGASYTEISVTTPEDSRTGYENKTRGSIVSDDREEVVFDTKAFLLPAPIPARYQLRRSSTAKYISARHSNQAICWETEKGSVPNAVLHSLANLIASHPDSIQKAENSRSICEHRTKSLGSHLKAIL